MGTPTFPTSAPELVDVAPFVGLEAGVDEGEALRVLRVVARELGVSERELAERLTGRGGNRAVTGPGERRGR